MELLHYTAIEKVDDINRDGLSKGDVPLTQNGVGMRAVWLTDDRDPSGHGLSDGEPIVVTPEVQARLRAAGVNAKLGVAWTFDKRAIRITVVIPDGDPALVRWSDWGPRHLAPKWYRELNRSGGGKAHTWWLYRGVISPDRITRIENLRTGELIFPTEGNREDAA
jgi:hypothetical protein